MPLDRATEDRIRAEARRRGVDENAAVDVARRSASSDSSGSEPSAPASDGRPVADRLLVGFLPFIKVRELRALWLGLADRVVDDEMMCGDFAAKHGGSSASAAPSGSDQGSPLGA